MTGSVDPDWVRRCCYEIRVQSGLITASTAGEGVVARVFVVVGTDAAFDIEVFAFLCCWRRCYWYCMLVLVDVITAVSKAVALIGSGMSVMKNDG